LLLNLPVSAEVLASWRLEDFWVTAVKLTNTDSRSLVLDPRDLQGNLFAATFQHRSLGAAGDSTDTTVVYLVTKGHGLSAALPPNVSPLDASASSSAASGKGTEHSHAK
jgi:integrating conjugative element protein (TIGR03749 family)